MPTRVLAAPTVQSSAPTALSKFTAPKSNRGQKQEKTKQLTTKQITKWQKN